MGQYSYVALGETVLIAASRNRVLKNLDLFVMACWWYAFDPDSSSGACVSHQFDIVTQMFNVCNQDILSPITAVHLMQTLMKGERVKKAAFLPAIPTAQAFVGVFPTNNGCRINKL